MTIEELRKYVDEVEANAIYSINHAQENYNNSTDDNYYNCKKYIRSILNALNVVHEEVLRVKKTGEYKTMRLSAFNHEVIVAIERQCSDTLIFEHEGGILRGRIK